eukprot:m.51793 g.51793  ORF g.51793 m.51793 type:complete len:587 (+) comp21501_c0_seq1:293-2053(+)
MSGRPSKKLRSSTQGPTPKEKFQNWGKTVTNTPSLTFTPTKVTEIQDIVKQAKANNKTVRCGGYRHSWSPVFSEDDEYFISMLPPDLVANLPSKEIKRDPNNELMSIELVGEPFKVDGKTKHLCRFGAAVTSQMFLNWFKSPTGGNGAWTIPIDVILVEVSSGGTFGAICHGTGVGSKTLADLITKLEFVNANGDLQVVDSSNEAQLKAVAGCFGLVGVTTHMTIPLDAMTLAEFHPQQVSMFEACPPMQMSDVPPQIQQYAKEYESKFAENGEKFGQAVMNSYYNEYFWSPLQKDVLVNNWKTNSDLSKVDKNFLSKWEVQFQSWSQFIASLLFESKILPRLSADSNFVYKWLYRKLDGGLSKALGDFFMLTQSTKEVEYPYLPDALHFTRGIQNIPCSDLEWSINIPLIDGEYDWSVVRNAWWAAIRIAYEYKDNWLPQQLPLEMRIMGNSDVALAVQKDFDLTCTIEVLTISRHGSKPPYNWFEYCQKITDAWSAIKDKSGNPVKMRPHWAKAWDMRDPDDETKGLKVNGVDIKTFLKTEYADASAKFKTQVTSIAQEGGWNPKDIKTRFGNKLFNELGFTSF